LQVVLVLGLISAVCIVSGVWALRIGPFTTSVPIHGAETFRTAISDAQSTADAQPGGPWTAFGGFGFALSASQGANISQLIGAFNFGGCPATLLPGASTIASLPATPDGPFSGISSVWIVEYSGAASILVVGVLLRSTVPILELGGSPTCPLIQSAILISPASAEIDSSVAAETAYAHGGARFTENHTKFQELYELTPGIRENFLGTRTIARPVWTVQLTNCGSNETGLGTLDGEIGAQFTATVNASNGALLSTNSTTKACGSTSAAGELPTTPLERAFAVGPSEEAEVGSGASEQFWYNYSVQSAAVGLEWTNMIFQVLSASGDGVTGPVLIQATDTSGSCVFAVYGFSTASWGVPADHGCPGTTTGGSASVLSGT
jgi:hypothetical protein